MKRLLGILASLGLASSATAPVVSCFDTSKDGIVNLSNLKESKIEFLPNNSSHDIEYIKKNINLIAALNNINPTEVTVSNFEYNMKDKIIIIDVVANKGAKTVSGEAKKIKLKEIPYVQRDIKTFITKTNLKEIKIAGELPTNDEIITAIKEQNHHSLVNAFFENNQEYKISDIKKGSAKIQAANDSKIAIKNSELNLTYSLKGNVDVKKDLSEVIKVTDLGDISIANDSPTESEIINALVLKNPDLQKFKTEVEITNKNSIDLKSAEVVAKKDSKNFKENSKITIKYNAIPKIATLKETIKKTNLDEIFTKNSVPTVEELLSKLKEVNPEIVNFISDIIIDPNIEIATTEATLMVKPDSKILDLTKDNQVKISYTIKNTKAQVTLKSLIEETDLGEIITVNPIPTSNEIIKALKENNPKVIDFLNDIEISQEDKITSNVAVLLVKKDSKKLDHEKENRIDLEFYTIANFKPAVPGEENELTDLSQPKPVNTTSVIKPENQVSQAIGK
ncbi:hypothetical protein SSABA_v1c05380 [Spiroplasma sabaudiense Ar-1343]|uniref:Chitinase n=1 Tax=Spiroplasma sabaudiense Ar-1343 TaxID=1276257 RepID=W6AAR4_9MOLU|nr:lipoprotein [Spiroplasma sabaudiense]AHI53945.1 hypothetical protein SSABA_v1c05380 [Spiroplasma sabaudiense Ar-1343]